MTGNSWDKQSFKSQVGIGSRLHDFDADEQIIFDISSFVAGFSDPKLNLLLLLCLQRSFTDLTQMTGYQDNFPL